MQSDVKRIETPLSGVSQNDQRQLLANGYEPIPICGKGPRWHWRREPITDHLLSQIESDPQFADHKNTGLRTGNLVGIDIDVRAPKHIEIVKNAVFAELGKTYLERVGSKGALLCYYNPTPIPKLTISGRPPDTDNMQRLVEILGDGQQVAAYGLHPTTGKPYQWTFAIDDDEPLYRKLIDLPQVTPDLLRAAAQKIGEALVAAGFRDVSVNGLDANQDTPSVRRGEPVSLSWIKGALHTVPPTVSRQEWLSVLWAVKEACIFPDIDDTDRIGLLDQWSSGELSETDCASYRGYSDVACSYDWAKGKIDRPAGIGTVAMLAERHGFRGGPPGVSLMELAIANDNLVVWQQTEPAGFKASAASRWPKLTRRGKEILEIPPAGTVVPDWLRDKGFTAILAQRGTGKTVVAVGLALCVATDKNWMWEPVSPGFYAIYPCGEDQENTAAHIEAWCNRYNSGEIPVRFIFMEDVPDLTSPGDCQSLVEHLRTLIPPGARAVIIADTWQRATSKAREGQNSDRDMVAAAENLETVAKAFQGPAIGCFHPPKADKATTTIHGSGVIENTSTGIWTLSKDNAGLRLEVARIKGRGLGNYKYVQIEDVPLGRRDRFGRDMTGALAVPIGGTMPSLLDRSEKEDAEREAVLAVVLDLIDRNIGVVRTHGNGQRPADVAVEVQKKFGLKIDKRAVAAHLSTLERAGRLIYVEADRNSRVKAGFQRPSPTENPAEMSSKVIPNSDENF